MDRPHETHTKRTLLRLTRAIESVYLAGQDADTLAVAVFERPAHYRESASLYESWAHETGPTAILAFPGPAPSERRGNVHTVAIGHDDPLHDEWIVLVADERRAASLRATALRGQPRETPDPDRLFAARITASPPEVAVELAEIADALASELTAPLLERLRDRARVCAALPVGELGDDLRDLWTSAPELP